jgi:GBP family porin
MRKRIIAVLAMSVMMSEAQAQSSVTLSGIIDGGLSFTNGVGAPDKNQWAYGQANLVVSRLIFSGAEDLGGGNQALFKLESGFCLVAVNRQTLVWRPRREVSCSIAARGWD